VFIYGLLRQRYFGREGNARIYQALTELGHLKPSYFAHGLLP
jgi:hypothetical protein